MIKWTWNQAIVNYKHHYITIAEVPAQIRTSDLSKEGHKCYRLIRRARFQIPADLRPTVTVSPQ